jgi:dihydrofolate reductase
VRGLTRAGARIENRAIRKVILGLGTSLDGYIARLDGAVDFLFMPKDYSMAEFFAGIDVMIMGRKTYAVGLKMGGPMSWPGMDTYVLTRTLPPAGAAA